MKFGYLKKNWYSLFDKCANDWENGPLKLLVSQLNLLMQIFKNLFRCLWKQPKIYDY